MAEAPANATELLDRAATDRPCLTGEWGWIARAIKGQKWQWNRQPRVPIRERKIEMSRGEVLAACFLKPKEITKMLTLSGTARFVDKGQIEDPKAPATGELVLDLQVQIQPHVPVEHDLLERIAKNPDNRFELVQGQLVLKLQESSCSGEPTCVVCRRRRASRARWRAKH
jgi:hypothetical protein